MKENAANVTYHSMSRSKERCGFKNKKTIVRNIELALERGKRADEFTSWERNFLRNEAYDDCFAVAYNNYCYIFNSKDVCVTIYDLPAWFGKKKWFDGKERIRNCKSYSRQSLEMGWNQ